MDELTLGKLILATPWLICLSIRDFRKHELPNTWIFGGILVMLAIALGEGKISHIPTSYWAFRKVADTLREASLSLPKAPRARDNTSVPEIPADTTARYKFINENAYAGWILLNSRARKDAPPEITARATLYILVDLQIFIAELTLLEPTWGELKDLENFLEDYLPGIRLTHGEFEDQHPDAPPPEW